MPATQYAQRARQTKAEFAASIGIDDALISTIVETFYARVRRHALLGPVFEAHVADWPLHLAKMKDFWASIAMESGRFHGNPMARHIAIGSLSRAHFDQWLALFSETLDQVVERPEARDFFRERAARIADSLHMGIKIERNGFRPSSDSAVRETQSC